MPGEGWDGHFEDDDFDRPELPLPVGPKQRYAYGCFLHHLASARWGPSPADWPDTVDASEVETDYHEKIAQTDAGIERLIQALKDRDLYDDTLIIVSADHGESTVEHDYYFGHSLLYNDVLHVPLLIKFPGNEHGGAAPRGCRLAGRRA